MESLPLSHLGLRAIFFWFLLVRVKACSMKIKTNSNCYKWMIFILFSKNQGRKAMRLILEKTYKSFGSLLCRGSTIDRIHKGTESQTGNFNGNPLHSCVENPMDRGT